MGHYQPIFMSLNTGGVEIAGDWRTPHNFLHRWWHIPNICCIVLSLSLSLSLVLSHHSRLYFEASFTNHLCCINSWWHFAEFGSFFDFLMQGIYIALHREGRCVNVLEMSSHQTPMMDQMDVNICAHLAELNRIIQSLLFLYFNLVRQQNNM